MNRFGDCILLICLGFLTLEITNFSTTFSTILPSTTTVALLGIAFLTKTAIFPFSSWLPIAISAPTPISALVHSSTLVTAGLYLLIRFSYFFYRNFFFINILISLGLYTSFYAGLSRLFETDYKKLIALSTLRHLGFILIAYSLGLLKLAYFHLLCHALFKALLFIGMGGIILNSNHFQDGRYIRNLQNIRKFSRKLVLLAVLSLLALPSLRGYFSKDLIIENFFYSSINSYFNGVIIAVNILFTFCYSLKLRSLNFTPNLIRPYQSNNHSSLSHIIGLFSMGGMRVFFGHTYLKVSGILLNEVRLTFGQKNYPLFFILFTLRLVFFLKKV
jgi:NADH-ubiquinone oxidoreductase chain 5